MRWILLGVAAFAVALTVWLMTRKPTPDAEATVEAAPAAEPRTAIPAAPRTAPAAAKPTVQPLPVEQAGPRQPMPDYGLQWLREARELRNDGQWQSARARAYDILEQSTDPAALNGAQELLDVVNIEIFLSPADAPEKVDYVVRSGDTLGDLADRFHTTVELLRKSNNIRGSLIRVGDLLRIPKGTFSIVADKSDNRLTVFFNGRYFKQYLMGTGKYGKTPVGRFKIGDRIPQPPWWRPDGRQIPYGDPDNLLGTHWLQIVSLDRPELGGYGIHGTWEPETIGKQESAGCIRLMNEDIEELFTLMPTGALVEIRE